MIPVLNSYNLKTLLLILNMCVCGVCVGGLVGMGLAAKVQQTARNEKKDR